MAAEEPSAPCEPRPDSILTATTHASGHRDDSDDPPEQYTGVVIIHGIGNQKRNSTLVEAVDTLSYWFNYHAGLDLQPKGAGCSSRARHNGVTRRSEDVPNIVNSPVDRSTADCRGTCPSCRWSA